jgi:exodeoxyribonuclease V alpha subunit
MVGGQGGGAVLNRVLEWVTFANPETGYTIARIAPERGRRGAGHGGRAEMHSYATVLPATAAGIQKYLGSGLIKGIGPVMAERMVAHFGVDIMHVIDD